MRTGKSKEPESLKTQQKLGSEKRLEELQKVSKQQQTRLEATENDLEQSRGQAQNLRKQLDTDHKELEMLQEVKRANLKVIAQMRHALKMAQSASLVRDDDVERARRESDSVLQRKYDQARAEVETLESQRQSLEAKITEVEKECRCIEPRSKQQRQDHVAEHEHRLQIAAQSRPEAELESELQEKKHAAAIRDFKASSGERLRIIEQQLENDQANAMNVPTTLSERTPSVGNSTAVTGQEAITRAALNDCKHTESEVASSHSLHTSSPRGALHSKVTTSQRTPAENGKGQRYHDAPAAPPDPLEQLQTPHSTCNRTVTGEPQAPDEQPRISAKARKVNFEDLNFTHQGVDHMNKHRRTSQSPEPQSAPAYIGSLHPHESNGPDDEVSSQLSDLTQVDTPPICRNMVQWITQKPTPDAIALKRLAEGEGGPPQGDGSSPRVDSEFTGADTGKLSQNSTSKSRAPKLTTYKLHQSPVAELDSTSTALPTYHRGTLKRRGTQINGSTQTKRVKYTEAQPDQVYAEDHHSDSVREPSERAAADARAPKDNEPPLQSQEKVTNAASLKTSRLPSRSRMRLSQTDTGPKARTEVSRKSTRSRESKSERCQDSQCSADKQPRPEIQPSILARTRPSLRPPARRDTRTHSMLAGKWT